MPDLETNIYPMMPLRDIVLFPYMVAPLVVGRSKSIKALEQAMSNRTSIFLSAQIDATVDEPVEDEIHRIGTVASVLQLLRLPDGTIKALVEGKQRGRIVSFLPGKEHFTVEVEEFPETIQSDNLTVAYIREILASFKQYSKHNKKIPSEVIKSLSKIENPAKFIDFLAGHLPVNSDEKQKILSTIPLLERMELVLSLIHKESEIASLEENIRSQVKKKMEKTQKDYYLAEQMRIIQKEMGWLVII